MAWSDLMKIMDNAVINTLGTVQATFIPQNGSGPQTITGLIHTPAMEEDFTPGDSDGTSSIRLFVRIEDISPRPQRGDVIAVNGVSYVLSDPDADTQGGAILKLRAL